MVGRSRLVLLALLAVAGMAASCGGQSLQRDGVTGEAGESSGGAGVTTGGGGRSGDANAGGGQGGAGDGASTGGFSAGAPAASSCDRVTCQGPALCPDGSSFRRAPGACCATCLPDDGLPVACPEVACPAELECPLGYTAGGGERGGCCHECVPDPSFCVTHDECILASKRVGTSCCVCPQVISARLYREDACWFGGPDGRAALGACSGDCGSGDVACPCASLGEPYCADNRCVSAFIPPPR